jgi:hypothetical protein
MMAAAAVIGLMVSDAVGSCAWLGRFTLAG